MKRLPLVIALAALCGGVALAGSAPAAAKSRYDRVLKSPAGREKLAKIAKMEESAKFDPALAKELAADREALIRARCAEALGRIGDPAGVPYLARLASDGSDIVAATAAYSLGLVGDTLALEPLRKCLSSKSKTVKMRAIEALGKTGKRGASHILAPLLRHFDGAVRSQAALALAFAGDSAAARELDAVIYDPDPRVASCAAYAIGRLGYKARIDEVAALLSSDNAEVRLRAAEALGRLKAAGAVPSIAPLMKDRDRWVALRAAEALGRIGSSRAADELAKVLVSQDPYLKTAALRGLAAAGEKSHFDSVKPLLDDPSPMVRRAALEAAAKADRGRARERLLRAFERGTPREKSTALELLGASGASDDLPLLVRTLRDGEDVLLREGAAAGLGNWENRGDLEKPCGVKGDRGAEITPFDALVEAANGGDWVVASIAVESLGKTAPGGVAPALVRVYDAHGGYNDGDRKLAVIEAIGAIGSRIDDKEIEELSLPAFLARAATDPDARVAAAASGAAAKLDLAIAAAPAGSANRGRYPWGEPSIPLGNRKILVKTARGEIEIELFGDEAPNAVKSVLTLAAKGFYDGLSFMRVVPGFVIQGGCPRNDGWGDAGYLLRNEVNMHRYERGAVGMADSGKDTAGSQFFIMHAPYPHLNGRYVVIGRVTRGMNVVDAVEEGDAFSVDVIE